MKKALGIALVASMMVVTVAVAYFGYRSYRLFRNPSASMWPLLPVGTSFNVNTFARKPERGSVVVFKYPPQPKQDFIKRVVGVAGDTIEQHANGELVINGWTVPRCAAGRATLASEEGPRSGDLFVEHLGTTSYVVFFTEQTFPASTGPWTVAPGQFFVTGDNRWNSHDSRVFGSVPDANVIGTLRGKNDPSELKSLASSAAAIRACMVKRPAQTDPPPAK